MNENIKEYALQENDGRVFGFYGAPLEQLSKDELIRLVKELDHEMHENISDNEDYKKSIETVISDFEFYTA